MLTHCPEIRRHNLAAAPSKLLPEPLPETHAPPPVSDSADMLVTRAPLQNNCPCAARHQSTFCCVLLAPPFLLSCVPAYPLLVVPVWVLIFSCAIWFFVAFLLIFSVFGLMLPGHCLFGAYYLVLLFLVKDHTSPRLQQCLFCLRCIIRLSLFV